MVMLLQYFATMIYFLISDISVTSWEGLQACAQKKNRPFNELWAEETKRIRIELCAYCSKPILSNLQTLELFLHAWEVSWVRNVIGTEVFAGWGKTQAGKERNEWTNAMDWYWQDVSSIMQKIVEPCLLMFMTYLQ
jgi:hypothetical protein